jgi:hypothetical protein
VVEGLHAFAIFCEAKLGYFLQTKFPKAWVGSEIWSPI